MTVNTTGHTVKEITFFPEVEGRPGKIAMGIWLDDGSLVSVWFDDYADARKHLMHAYMRHEDKTLANAT